MNAALELVNSEWWRGRPSGLVDKLEDDGWLASYMEAAGFGDLELPSARDRGGLRRLRGILRRLVEDPSSPGLASLDAFTAAAPMRRRVEARGVVLEPVCRDWGWVMAEIAASFVQLVADGDASRLKTCANHECQWTFYDESKNRNRRWCGAASCGTADKVRRFRERRRLAQARSG